MPATLYLGFEGVLHPNAVNFEYGQWPRLRMPGHVLFENCPALEQVIRLCPQTRIVLHTWWVALVSFRAAREALPAAVQERVIGATWPGNRLARFERRPISSRRDWLQRDLLRRQPVNPILLDYDPRQVPAELLDSACIVDGECGIASTAAREKLVLLLTAANTINRPAGPISEIEQWTSI